MIDRRKEFKVVAVGVEDGNEQVEVDGGHLGAQDGVALLFHFLGELDLRECSGFRLTRDALGNERAGFGLALAALRLDQGLACGNVVRELIGIDTANGASALNRAFVHALVGLIFEGSQKRTDANARGAQVGHLIDLEHRVDLAGTLEDLLNLIGGNGVKAATEAVQLNQVKVVSLGHDLGGTIQAGVVHPLVHGTQGSLDLAQVSNGVLGEHG